jgi:hypothetical protein
VITKSPSRILLSTLSDLDILEQIALFSCTGLFVSLLVLTCGVDLSLGFF